MKQITAALMAAVSLYAAPVDPAIASVEAQNETARHSQNRIDALNDKSDTLFDAYRDVLRQSEQTRAYNAQMERLVASQKAEVASLEEQIGEIEETNKALIPLMHRMIDSLGKFIAIDLPFLMPQRTQRVAELKTLMDDASVTLAEKYRKIMEAYALENEYGRTIESYRTKRTDDARTVDFLRIGRTALYYLTIDGAEGGLWDKQCRTWVALDGSQRSHVRQGIKIARKQATPDLMILPVNTAEAHQ
jgi:hypothetical protein